MTRRKFYDDGDHHTLRIEFFPITDPTANYPTVWPTPKPHWRNPDVSGYDIDWWNTLHIGYTVQDATLWCNEFNVAYSEEITEYENGTITDMEYEVGGKWYTSEQVGWMYALYTLSNVLSLGLLQDAWSKQWLRLFEGFYHARRYISVTEYRWSRKVNIYVSVDCEGIVDRYSKEYYPEVRPSDAEGRPTTLVQEFDGNVNKGDPNPTSDSWIGTAVNNIDKAVTWAADNGMPIGPTITVTSPTETIVEPIKVSTGSDTNLSIPQDSPLALTSPEELLTSYEVIIELNDPDGATAIAAYPSNSSHSNVYVAVTGSYAAGPYSHPGYTIDELIRMQASGIPISRADFQNTFGIVLPPGVQECVITNVNIDNDTTGSLYGDTTYTPGIYVGSTTDKYYYPSNAQQGTITVMHR